MLRGGVIASLRRDLQGVVDFCFPPKCLLCAAPLAGASPCDLCPDCLAGFLPLHPPFCPCCALPFETIGGRNHLCGDCILHPPAFVRTVALGLYEETLRHAIHALKFDGAINLDRPLAQRLYRAWEESEPPWQPTLIVPVPLAPSRLRLRTYNQSRLLAKELGRSARLPVAEVLRRVRETDPQPGLSARERRENLAGAFQVVKPMSGEDVLLVDDVMTTGATARECAAALLSGGAGRVAVAVLARARRGGSRMGSAGEGR